MNYGILDLDDNLMSGSGFTFSIPFSGEKLFSIKVVGRNNLFLMSEDAENVFYFGRFSDSDSWTSLAIGLDLTPFTSILKEIKIKVSTNESTIAKQQSTKLFLRHVNS